MRLEFRLTRLARTFAASTLLGGALAFAGALPLAGQAPDPAYLFGPPPLSLSVRGGILFPRAASDAYDEVTRYMTMDKGDFASRMLVVDMGVRLNDRTDLAITTGYARVRKTAEYRDYVEGPQDLPITQQIGRIQIPLDASVRYFLMPRGDQIGRYAWMPRRVAPYVGAGGGLLWHRFRRTGDFIDLRSPNLPISTDDISTDGWVLGAHVVGGADVTIGRHTAVRVDGRYTWSGAQMNSRFAGYNNLDLAGPQITAGLVWRF